MVKYGSRGGIIEKQISSLKSSPEKFSEVVSELKKVIKSVPSFEEEIGILEKEIEDDFKEIMKGLSAKRDVVSLELRHAEERFAEAKSKELEEIAKIEKVIKEKKREASSLKSSMGFFNGLFGEKKKRLGLLESDIYSLGEKVKLDKRSVMSRNDRNVTEARKKFENISNEIHISLKQHLDRYHEVYQELGSVKLSLDSLLEKVGFFEQQVNDTSNIVSSAKGAELIDFAVKSKVVAGISSIENVRVKRKLTELRKSSDALKRSFEEEKRELGILHFPELSLTFEAIDLGLDLFNSDGFDFMSIFSYHKLNKVSTKLNSLKKKIAKIKSQLSAEILNVRTESEEIMKVFVAE